MYFNYNGSWTGGPAVVGATSPSTLFYFAEGTTRPDFEPYFCIQNPGSQEAQVKITYMMGDGSEKEQELAVAPHSRATVNVASYLGSSDDIAHDFSATVETTNGQAFVCERPMYFNYNGSWTGGPAVVGATSPSTLFYFAEGTTRPDFEPYFCIQNPGSQEAQVKITYMMGDGTTKEQELGIVAHSRATINVASYLGSSDDIAHDFSATVETTNGEAIVAERPMYFNYNGTWTGGSDVLGATSPSSIFSLARRTTSPGFVPYFCIQNPASQETE